MSTGDRILTAAVGIAAVVWAFLPGASFYPGGLGLRPANAQPVPKWFGRLWFVAIGTWCVYMAVDTNARRSNLVGAAIGATMGVYALGWFCFSLRRMRNESRGERAQAWVSRALVLVAGGLFLYIAWWIFWTS